MRGISSVFLVLFVFAFSNFAQTTNDSVKLSVLRVSAPVYPALAIHFGLEEKIVVSLKVDSTGTITSSTFDRGDKNFKTVIEDSLKEWKFNVSKEVERSAEVVFIFTLLPHESKTYLSSIFSFPGTVQIFAKRGRILDSSDIRPQ